MTGSTKRQYPSVTVDIVVIARRQSSPQILLIQRRKPPFAGQWSLPGGFVNPYEPLEAAARRELREETGLEPAHLEQMQTFGDPGRDPRGWTISVACLALLDAEETRVMRPRAGSDAAAARWFDLRDLPPLAFDHADIVACAARRLAGGL